MIFLKIAESISVSQSGRDFASKHLETLLTVRTLGGGATGIQQVEARDAADILQCTYMYKTIPHKKEWSGPKRKASSDKAKKHVYIMTAVL